MDKYVFHYVCYFLISNLQSIIYFVLWGCHINLWASCYVKYLFIVINSLKQQKSVSFVSFLLTVGSPVAPIIFPSLWLPVLAFKSPINRMQSFYYFYLLFLVVVDNKCLLLLLSLLPEHINLRLLNSLICLKCRFYNSVISKLAIINRFNQCFYIFIISLQIALLYFNSNVYYTVVPGIFSY